MSNPVIVIVPGAWHRPKHYQHVIDGLEKVNYEAVGVTLPSVDSIPPHPSWDQDAQEIRDVILGYLNTGKDVITVAHSFGGVSMSEAVQGLGKDDRERQGLKGAVLRLVYICAMILPAGKTHLEQLVPVSPEEEEIERMKQELQAKLGPGLNITADGAMHLDKKVVGEVLYNGCTPEDIKKAISLLGSFPSGPLAVPATYSAFYDFPCTYIVCKNDRALPSVVQERIVAQSPENFFVERCDEGHSPFLSNPGYIVECIRRAAGEDVTIAWRLLPISHVVARTPAVTHADARNVAASSQMIQTLLRKKGRSSAKEIQSVAQSELPGFNRGLQGLTDASNDLIDPIINDFSSWLDMDLDPLFATDLAYNSTNAQSSMIQPAQMNTMSTSNTQQEGQSLVTSHLCRQPSETYARSYLTGNLLHSPIHLLTSKLDASILDERLVQIFNVIVSGSASRFMDYECNMYATGNRYHIESDFTDSTHASSPSELQSPAVNSSALMLQAASPLASTKTSGQVARNNDGLESDSCNLTLIGCFRFLDHLGDLYGNRLTPEARRQSDAALKATIRVFSLQWLPISAKCAYGDRDSELDNYTDAWFRAQSLIGAANSVRSFRVVLACLMFAGTAVPSKLNINQDGTNISHEILRHGLQKLRELDGLVKQYCATLGSFSKYANLAEASLSVIRWSGFLRDTGAALTTNYKGNLPSLFIEENVFIDSESSSSRPTYHDLEDLDRKIPSICRKAALEKFCVYKNIVDVKLALPKVHNGSINLSPKLLEAITSAVTAVGRFNDLYRPFMTTCRANFENLSIPSRISSVSTMTFWDLGVLILAEELKPFANEINQYCGSEVNARLHTYRSEAALSVPQNIETMLSLPDEEMFNLQNGLSAEVPIFAYHVTPSLVVASLEKAVEHIIDLQFPVGKVDGLNNGDLSFDDAAHHIDCLIKGLLSLDVTIGGSQTAGVAFESLMRKYGDIISECWSCNYDT
ncbi:hypothetical protein N7495_005140 [Penicillium taxi]|uniref:uncharacterized protein n=1 Tax=Penicillium taxi TaxID=168475 RepID=UPI00254514D5|nr:uncharacterized protein N7495_005140 [Penicillium taxi]KAJ5893449.1 hypothetical protein N7495_005140 [Penicillium taxi]